MDNPFSHLPKSLQPQPGQQMPAQTNQPRNAYVTSAVSHALAKAAMGPEPTFNPAWAPSALANYLRLTAMQEQTGNSAHIGRSRSWEVGS